ncbi:MAG: LamB/YcsF family protein [Planctomycetaceae bacterium]|nr:LamB/YcsF family protein [Planctomycetaceae bacterium]
MNKTINLNADLGESFGAWTMGEDEALLQVVRSANIACGFHAGDPVVMRHTVRTALAAGVSLGAHPAYPDLQGFGRRPLKMAPAELEAMVIYQVGALAGMAAAEGGRVTHVKPHGALNNQASEDIALADAVARLRADGKLAGDPLRGQVAAVSVGVVGGTPMLDLAYNEDAGAEVDLNVVMTEAGDFVEIQGTGEKRAFTPAELEAMLALARKGCMELLSLQRESR